MTVTATTSSSPRVRVIALAGNPNSGKSTVFNALTGLHQKTGNYAGVTVEKRTGRCRLGDGRTIEVIDLPGTYSLISRSPDERIAVEVLSGRVPGTPRPDAVIVVVDASNLQRNLYLVSQLIEMGVRLVVALNMMDVAQKRGLHVDHVVLREKLGVPVVPIVASKGRGIEELKQQIDFATAAAEPEWPLPAEFRQAIDELTPLVSEIAPQVPLLPRALAERLLIDEDSSITLSNEVRQRVKAAQDRLHLTLADPMRADIEAHYRWIEEVAHRALSPAVDFRVKGREIAPLPPLDPAAIGLKDPVAPDFAPKPILGDTVDRVLLHRFWGLLSFAIIMSAIFVSVFWLADPIMGAVESGVTLLGSIVAAWIPEGTLRDLWTDGIVAGVGAVVVFVPQIAILFLFLSILEDSGYLARAAFLMDRLLGKLGLSGKSFIPLLSGFACAIPGIMATRTIEDRRARLTTIFVLPFMSCSARLPVYALLIGAFFAAQAAIVRGAILLGLYLIGILAAAGTAWVFNFRKQRSATSFILELPSYKWPQTSLVARTVWTNTAAFVTKAGTIIFCMSVILWAMTYWPRLSEESANVKVAEARAAHVAESGTELGEEAREQILVSEQLRQSFAGRFGHAIEPAIRPLGFDWKMGVGLVGAFAAREVFVSTMGIVYAAGDAEEDPTSLVDAMKNDRHADGRAVWTPLVGITMLIWFVIAMQCMSTLAIVRRETQSWRWPIAMLLYMNGLAYLVCLVVYQVGSRIAG